MTRPITLILSLAFIILRHISFAQDELTEMLARDSKRDTKAYFIRSLEGKKRKVIVMPDYVSHVLKIYCLKDTVRIDGYWDVPPKVHLLGNNFIKVDYEVRGGSGVGLGNTVIICIRRHKLFEAMHALRYLTGEGAGEEDIYKINVNLIKNDKRIYNLTVKVHDEVHSKYTPEINYNYNNNTVLSFDRDKNVFYSIKGNLYGTFNMYDPKTEKETQQQVRGNYPVIILGKNNYYFIKDGWYALGDNNSLQKYTSRPSL
jgi:hypothetical protein